MKKISLNFIFFFFIFSSLTKGAEQTNLQMDSYVADLTRFQNTTSALLQKWKNSAKTSEGKVSFVKEHRDLIHRLFAEFNPVNDNVSEAINVKQSYSEMSRAEVSKILKLEKTMSVKEKGFCNPCTKIPCLDDQVWANEFWKFISFGACCDCDVSSYGLVTGFTLGLYPVLMGVPYLATHLIQGLGFLLTLPCRPRCSLDKTDTIETYNTSLDSYFEDLVNKIGITLILINKFKDQKIDNNELPVADTVTLNTGTLEKQDQKDGD